MTTRIWSFRTFAALWGILLGPLLPLQAGEADVAGQLPPDTLGYVAWARLAGRDDPGAAQLEALLEQPAGREPAGLGRGAPALALKLLAQLYDKPGALALLDVAARDGRPDIQLVAFFDAGRSAPGVAQTFEELVQRLLPQARPTSQPVAGGELKSAAIAGTPLTLLWGVREGRFLVALGRAAAEKIIGQWQQGGRSLADSRELKFLRAKLGVGAEPALFSAYGDVRALVTRLKATAEELSGPLPALAERLLEALGVNAVRAKYMHCSASEQGTWTRVFAHVEGQRKGLLKLWGQQPLAPQDLGLLPADAYWGCVWQLDLAGLWRDARATVAEISPDAGAMLDGALAMTTGLLGFSLGEDLLPAFGDTWALYDARAHGGLLLTGSVLVAEVKDRQAVQEMLSGLVARLKPLLQVRQVELLLRETRDGPHKINYLVLGGLPCPLAPAWGFVGDRAVFGLFPQTVAAALNHVDPQTRRASLVDQPEFQRLAGRILSERVESLCFCDARYFARLLYPLGLLYANLGSSLLAGAGVRLDPAAYPGLEQVVARARNAYATCAVDEDGIVYKRIGSGATALAAAAMVGLAVSILLPALSRARELAKRSVSAANLRAIAVAAHTYATDHDRQFPASLEELVELGLISRQTLNSPRDRAGAVSFVYIPGQSLASDPRNLLAYERVSGVEGTNVVHVDGHVEWLKPAAFKRALKATYERLGRQEELPVRP